MKKQNTKRQDLPSLRFSPSLKKLWRTRKFKTILILIIFFSFFGLVENSQAAELHVGSGQTYSTIASAITASSSGDTIYIHEGTYNEKSLVPKSGTDNANRTTLIRVTGENKPVIGAASYSDREATFNLNGHDNITLDGLVINGSYGGNYDGAVVMGASDTVGGGGSSNNITVQNCDLTASSVNVSQASTIRIGAGNSWINVLIYNCNIDGNFVCAGVRVNATGAGSIGLNVLNNKFINSHIAVAFKWGDDINRDINVENNIIQDSTQRSFTVDQSYVSITNNVIDTMASESAIGENWGGANCTIIHNTIYVGGITSALSFRGFSNDNVYYDNIFYNPSTIIDYGSNNTTGGHDNYSADPTFTDATSHDFTLATGSGAIGTASDSEDYGADLSLVGIDAGDETPPSYPIGLSVE